MKNKKSQVAIEFLLLIMSAFFMTMVLLIVAYSFSEAKNKEKTFYEVDDYGKSLQQDMMLASEMEDGYVRKINLPLTINGNAYNISLDQNSQYTSFLKLSFQTYSFDYVVPAISGSIVKGSNYIIKNNTGLYIVQ